MISRYPNVCHPWSRIISLINTHFHHFYGCMDQGCLGRTSSCPTIRCDQVCKVDLIGLVVTHIWAVVPNYKP